MARENNCSWHFAEHKGGLEQGANNAVAQNFKKHQYASIVRESIQNSLDAVSNPLNPVVVKFTFGKIDGIQFPRFFDLKDHIQGCIDYFNTDPKAHELYEPMTKYFSDFRSSQSISYIRISDYNTKGMDYYENGDKGTFYAFMKVAGYNLKNDEGSGGSFGFGKGAYFIMSPIRTLLISTKNLQGKVCFEGVSMLSTHTLNNVKDKKYVSVGYYDDNSNPEQPVTDIDKIPVPFRRDQPGTHFYIMGFDMRKEEEAKNEMIKGVLRHFWMAILRNKLEVIIGKDEETGITITKDTIGTLMEKYYPSESDTTNNGSSEMNPRPYYDAVVNQGTDEKKYCSFITKIDYLGNVQFYIHKTKNAIDGDKVVFMRKLLMMVDKKKQASSQGYYGVFICEDKEGNKILQEMENPAHDEWRASNWEKKGSSTGRAALSSLRAFIADSISSIFSTGDGTKLRISGLEKYLYTPHDLTSGSEEEEGENPFSGDKTGKITKTNGASITTDAPENQGETETTSSTTNGEITAVKSGDATPDENGETTGAAGPGHHKSQHKGGNKHPNRDYKSVTVEPNEAVSYRTFVDVKYRPIAQKENDEYIHYLQIDCPYDVTQGEIVFMLDKDPEYEVGISNVNNGNVKKDEVLTIENVILHTGLNTIKIKFEDSQRKHGIKLEAYSITEINK